MIQNGLTGWGWRTEGWSDYASTHTIFTSKMLRSCNYQADAQGKNMVEFPPAGISALMLSKAIKQCISTTVFLLFEAVGKSIVFDVVLFLWCPVMHTGHQPDIEVHR